MPLGRIQKTKISITKVIVGALLVVAFEVWLTFRITGIRWDDLERVAQMFLLFLYGIIALILTGIMAFGMKINYLWNS